MATYKVIQDIEAEDKFVGPLTLRQFIEAGIAVVCGYLIFVFLTKNLWILALPLIPVMLAAGFLAFPWGKDQSTEVWLLAKIRFLLKPRRRIWNQSGIQELVTITAPKHMEQFTGNNLSETEVKSRLKALAETIDSRGWAVKNASVNYYNQPSAMANTTSDRLIDAGAFTREVPNVDVRASDDILDEKNNPTALHLNELVNASSQAHRQATLESLKQISQHKDRSNKQGGHTDKPDFWFMREPDRSHLPKDYTAFGAAKTVSPTTDSSTTSQSTTTKPAATIKHHKKSAKKPGSNRGANTSKEPLKPGILELANNNDLTVATIAHEANKKPLAHDDGQHPEVVVPLR